MQKLGLNASTAMGLGLIPGEGTKTPQAMRCGQKDVELFTYAIFGINIHIFKGTNYNTFVLPTSTLHVVITIQRKGKLLSHVT